MGRSRAAERAPKRRCVRHRTQLAILEARGSITLGQKRAGERLSRDFRISGSQIGRLVARYEPGPRPPRQYLGGADTPAKIDARARYEATIQAASKGLSPILVHVCLTDGTP